ncbi:PorT family protein [candidate division KSB1 bacterium]|nr:PorT family protein [Candidatus Aminicenantes bacterium]RQW03666.1 MAG: PorT family protein [candidate division KSB1 bacterium]
MNNKIATVLLLFLLTQTMPANDIKVMLGLNSSTYVFSSSTDSLDQQHKSGLAFGLGWAYSLNKNMKLEINAMFNQKGAKVSIINSPNAIVSGVYKNSSIGIPCFFRYQYKEKASPYFSFGPEFVFVTSHHLFLTESNESYNLSDMTKKIILAFNALLGYEYPIGKWGLFAEIRYNYWFSNFLNDPEALVKSQSFVFLLGGVYYL